MKQFHLKTTKCIETIEKSLTPFKKSMCLVVRLAVNSKQCNNGGIYEAQ